MLKFPFRYTSRHILGNNVKIFESYCRTNSTVSNENLEKKEQVKVKNQIIKAAFASLNDNHEVNNEVLLKTRLTTKREDLTTICNVKFEDEAIKLIETISIDKMVKIFTILSQKKRRPIQLLRSLSHQISSSSDKLSLKLASDVLFSMSTLNFIDENLLEKVSNDIYDEIVENMVDKSEKSKSVLIGSILTSLGLLKYKNELLLNFLLNWVKNNIKQCRSHDLFKMFVTMAILNHKFDATEFNAVLKENEANTTKIWLNHIWSKTLLNVSTSDEISNVLNENFIKTLDQSSSTKLKLLNLNGSTNCFENYNGNKLTESYNVKIMRTKEKLEMCESVINALKNLIQSEEYIRTNIDSGFGFFIDIELKFDKNFPLKAASTGVPIAIVVLDYHDMTIGKNEPTGINAFKIKLLENFGYKVLVVPYYEYKIKDKLINKVKYLEEKLKNLVIQ